MRKDLHVGLILALTIRGLAVTSYEEMRRVAGLAEKLGFDSVWLCDHFLTLAPDAYATGAGMAAGAGHGAGGGEPRSVPLLECWTALSALARDTRRLRLGTSVLCHSYRLPSVLAKMGATLDVISGGRLDLGLGAGWFEQEYRAYGIPFPRLGERIAQLDEGVEVMRRMWTEPHPVSRGRHYAIDGAVCDPLPLQQPHPPIWIGGEGDRVHRVAARVADGVNVRWWGPSRIAGRGAYLDAACREFGRDPRTLERSVTVLLIPDRDAARAAATRERFDSASANAKGRPYTRQFDGEHDIPTVEGPVLTDLESHADYPAEVADWYETMAREVVRALSEAEAQQRIASDDSLWSGPRPQQVRS